MNRPRPRFRWLPTQPMTILERITSRRNARLLFRLLSIFLSLVTASTVVFQVLMDMEGQRHRWLTGLYWTFTTMTTLGLGDIAFTSDLGRMFTVGVLVAGVTFLLVMLPFTLIQLFQSSARIPRELPNGTRGHVVLTQAGSIGTPGFPYKFAETPAGLHRPPPLLGEHTTEVLSELLGYSTEQIDLLRKEKVI